MRARSPSAGPLLPARGRVREGGRLPTKGVACGLFPPSPRPSPARGEGAAILPRTGRPGGSAIAKGAREPPFQTGTLPVVWGCPPWLRGTARQGRECQAGHYFCPNRQFCKFWILFDEALRTGMAPGRQSKSRLGVMTICRRRWASRRARSTACGVSPRANTKPG